MVISLECIVAHVSYFQVKDWIGVALYFAAWIQIFSWNQDFFLMLSFTHDFTELMNGVDSRFGVKQCVFLVEFFVLCLPTNGV